MKTSIVRLGIAGLLITLVGLLGVLHLHQRHGELRQLEKFLHNEMAANQRQRQALRSAQTKAAPTAPAAKVAAAPIPAAPAPPPTNLARGSRLSDELRTLPEYAPFEQRRLRRLTLRRYGELFAELKLTPEREDALKKILDERLGEAMNASRIVQQGAHDPGGRESARSWKQTQEAAEAKIAALLSDEEHAAYSRFEKSSAWCSGRQHELDELVADRGLAPLSPVQKQTLAAAYYEAHNRKPDPTEGQLTDVALQRRRYDEMAKLAAARLDPRQRAVLADYLTFDYTRGEILGRLCYPEKPAGSAFVTVFYPRP